MSNKTTAIHVTSRRDRFMREHPELRPIIEDIASETMEETTLKLVQRVKTLESAIPELTKMLTTALKALSAATKLNAEEISKIDLTPQVIVEKGEPGKDGVDADEARVIAEVLKQIPTPENGKDGEDGADGRDADEEMIIERVLEQIPVPKNGEDGEDGSPDTPEAIANKLNTLEQQVDMKVIKGLGKWLNEAKRMLKRERGGGGMGNPQHESFEVNSGTTTVTTSQGIAAGGFAIWAFYQGQMIARGVGYTVSGRTLTLQFTPDDGTFIDIIYMRG